MAHAWFAAAAALVSLSAFAAAPPLFDASAYLGHVKFLASDDLRGRGNGSPELERAADYIAAQFARGGLEPAGAAGTYFQTFSVTTGAEVGNGNRLTLELGGAAVEAVLGRDFVPVAMGDAAKVRGEVVFAGYGITAEPYHYDDYTGLDVTDKVVLVLSHEPRESEATSPFDGAEPTIYGHENTKVINARYRSARAVLLVEDAAHAGSEAELPRTGEVAELGIPALRITRQLAGRILGSRDLAGLQKEIDAALAPRSFVCAGTTASIEIDVTRIRREVRNVVGLLPGTDPRLRDEVVVLGAHYDHLGLGGRSSMSPAAVGEIHNGADDNASGTAGLIELAAALARAPESRRRSYAFIAFAGEELGLDGSAFWTRNPTRALDKVVAMLNMDMIGRSRDKRVIVGGVGTSPQFRDLVASGARESGLELQTSESGYGASDHTSFYSKNVPVLFFFSGLHADYHRPSDDWDRIDAPAAVRIVSMVYSVATRLNVLDDRPAFTKIDVPLQTGGTRGGSGYGAYFGSIPDMTDEVRGVRFSDVRPASPAAKAGLRGGDVLVRFAGKEIRNLEDFTYMLRTHKPGDTVKVEVLREGKPLEVDVKLDVRR